MLGDNKPCCFWKKYNKSCCSVFIIARIKLVYIGGYVNLEVLERGGVTVMSRKHAFIASVALSTVFAFAFLFLTIEVPVRLNHLLRSYFPDLGFQQELIEEFIAQVRPLGYLCFIAVTVLAILGLTLKSRLSQLGSIIFFLPTFGYFAYSMFFLAGLGILRVLWMPLWDFSPELLKLGDVVYVPAEILIYLFALLGLDIRAPLSFLIMMAGLLIFFMAVSTWMFGKIRGKEIVDFWIYRFSRHPQYLGFLLWSYGLMLLATFTPFPRGGYFPEPSFPWLISALIVFCCAWKEEIQMMEKHGIKYSKYREQTSFLLPLPKIFSHIAALPLKIVIKRDYPKSNRDIVYAFTIYLIIFMGLSSLTLKLNMPLR